MTISLSLSPAISLPPSSPLCLILFIDHASHFSASVSLLSILSVVMKTLALILPVTGTPLFLSLPPSLTVSVFDYDFDHATFSPFLSPIPSPSGHASLQIYV